MANKKDYVAIAKIVSDLANEEEDIDKKDLVSELSDYFKDDNPNFDRDLFYEVCFPL